MALKAWQIAGLAFIGLNLLGGRSQPASGGGSSGGGGFSFGATQPAGIPVNNAGLFAMSADEDIGIAPAPGFADNSPTSPGSMFAPSTLQRQNVVLVGSQQTGFDLTGGVNLQGRTPIRVAGGEAIGAFDDFSTTPDVLARYIDEVAFAPVAFNSGNTFSLTGALLADPNFEITQFSLDADPESAEFLRRQSVDLDIGI